MTTQRQPHKDINDLINHLKDLTAQLTDVHDELYWLAMQAQEAPEQHPPDTTQLNVELLGALKGAVDNMRLLLWQYIETASEMDPQRAAEGLETQRLQRVTRFLELLRKRLGTADQQPVTFIERISAKMKERFRDKVA